MSRTYIPKVELKQVNLNSHSAQLKMLNIFGGRGEGGGWATCGSFQKQVKPVRSALGLIKAYK